MTFTYKIFICIFLVFALNTHAQTYPKYTTTKAKGTAAVKPEPTEAVTTEDVPVAEETILFEEEVTIKETRADKEPVADFNALMNRAQQEYLGQQYEKAFKTYTEAFTVCPDEFKHLVLTKRAWSYYAVKNFEKCIEDCTIAIEKTKMPNENTLGRVYVLRSLAYKSRNNPGDMERACADHQNAREAGVIQGQDLHGYDCNKK
jgi:tetratricopeptide (TPR) repeat protein